MAPGSTRRHVAREACGAIDTPFHRIWQCPDEEVANVRRTEASPILIAQALAAGETLRVDLNIEEESTGNRRRGSEARGGVLGSP